MRAKLDAAPPLPEPIDTAALQADVGNANIIAAAVAKLTVRAGHRKRADALDDTYREIEASINKMDEDKRTAIAGAKMPAGLAFGPDDEILLAGVPFDQASAAEQLRASTAIAMSLNPHLRVILIRDGSLLDADSMKLLAALAAEHDYQVFVERVAGDKPSGIVIEDGRIV